MKQRTIYCIKGVHIAHPIRLLVLFLIGIAAVIAVQTIRHHQNPTNLKKLLARTSIAKLDADWVEWLRLKSIPLPPESARLSVYTERTFSPDQHTFCLIEVSDAEFAEYVEALTGELGESSPSTNPLYEVVSTTRLPRWNPDRSHLKCFTDPKGASIAIDHSGAKILVGW